MLSRRRFLAGLSGGFATAALLPSQSFGALVDYNVRSYGAVGDGITVDTAALQRAIDAASANDGGRILIPGGARFLTGALLLPTNVELHLADDAMLLANPDPLDYGHHPGIINAESATGLRITGTGMIDGQAMQFMTTFSEKDERWEPKAFRPRIFSLHRCKDLEIHDIMFGHSPSWGLHMLGCDRVLVDGLRIRNFLEIPNCDGIDPDHCRDVEIRNCDIVGADDAIVIKASMTAEDYGPTHNISVRDCVVTTRDGGLKIGTETFGDISKILFERCKVISGGRGPTITHRQQGNIEDVEFRDIEVTAQHHAARWWGWGEAISITAWPRTKDGVVGSLRNIRLCNIRGRAENSIRIDGMAGKPIENVLLENIDMTIDKWTMYPGAHFDNRPTPPNVEGLEPHDTPVFFLRNAENVHLKNCHGRWGNNLQPYFSHLLEAQNVKRLSSDGLHGEAAHPSSQSRIVVK
jgi:polygalacturonase